MPLKLDNNTSKRCVVRYVNTNNINASTGTYCPFRVASYRPQPSRPPGNTRMGKTGNCCLMRETQKWHLASIGTYSHPQMLRQCQRPSHAPGNIRTERSRSQTSDRKDSCRWLQAPTCSQTVPGYHLRACTDSLDLQGNIHRIIMILY